MKIRTIALLLALILAAPSAQAAKVTFLDEGYLDIHGFIQPRIDVAFEPGAADEKTFDIYLRRTRLLFGGQINKHFQFFFGGLLLDMGRGGDFKPDLTLADAWLQFSLNKMFRVNAGLLKLPFGRHMQLSGGKLHGLDFHGFILQRAVGDDTGRNIPQRDLGVLFRGLLFSDKLDYRIGVMDGKEPGGDGDVPRFVGRIGLNVFDAEPEYHWNDAYFGKRRILSFGVSFDLQPSIAGNGDDLFYAFAFDAHADIPITDKFILVGTAAYHLFGPKTALSEDAVQKVVPQGHAVWGELGVILFKHYEPLVAVEWFHPKEGDKGKRLALMGGLNWWIWGHKANVKFQAGALQVNGADTWSETMSLQGQLFF